MTRFHAKCHRRKVKSPLSPLIGWYVPRCRPICSFDLTPQLSVERRDNRSTVIVPVDFTFLTVLGYFLRWNCESLLFAVFEFHWMKVLQIWLVLYNIVLQLVLSSIRLVFRNTQWFLWERKQGNTEAYLIFDGLFVEITFIISWSIFIFNSYDKTNLSCWKNEFKTVVSI